MSAKLLWEVATMENNNTNITEISLSDFYLDSRLDLFSENKIIKKHFKTGIEAIDKITDGGLCAGLTILSGMPSLGKSTFALQMASSIAENGNTALFFSIEMTRDDCIAKIISRNASLLSENRNIVFSASKLMNEEWLNNMTVQESSLKARAIEKTRKIANNLLVMDIASFNMTLSNILGVIVKYMKETQRKPIIFIDYLHLISAPNDLNLGSEKQVLDYFLKQLNAFAKSNDIAIVLISTINRDGYKEAKADMSAFCGTNLIEYGCDFALILDYTGKIKRESNFDIDEARNATVRKVTARVVKNRFGSSGANIDYLFIPVFNDFREVGSEVKVAEDIDEILFNEDEVSEDVRSMFPFDIPFDSEGTIKPKKG